MAKRTKYNDVVTIVDGVKYTVCEPRKPRASELTYPLNKSRYTAWAQGVSNLNRGTRGCTGTTQKIN